MAMRRTTRKKLGRLASYVLFFALVGLAIYSLNWEKFSDQFLRWDIAEGQLPGIVTIALKNTLLFTAVSFAGGLILGIIFALLRLSEVAPYRWFATAYIEVFRGLPALMTIFAVAYIVPIAFDFRMPGGQLGAGLIGLILVASAYMAEVIRGGIQAVPKGQAEASRSLGMSKMRTMIWVTLPQAFRIIIPPMTNEFVLLLKDTSLLFIAGTTLATKELTTWSRDAMTDAGNGTPLVVGALLYLVVTIPLTQLVAHMERRMAKTR